jgi:hypothetical protein
MLVGGFNDDVIIGGAGDDQLFGELPPGAEVPPIPLPPPARHDVCVGAGGFDTAVDCDTVASVEG